MLVHDRVTPSTHLNTCVEKGNLLPRVSHLNPWGEQGETLVGSGHVLIEQLEHQGGVLCNRAICRVELCCAVTAPAIVAFWLKFRILSIPMFI